jgi:hypothetical protein
MTAIHQLHPDHAATTSRRAMLGGAGATALAAAVVAVPTVATPAAAAPAMAATSTVHPDAALIAAAAEFRAARAECDRLESLPSLRLPYNHPEVLAHERKIADVCDRRMTAVDSAAEIPAGTTDGLRAKAGMVLDRLPEHVRYNEVDEDDGEIRLVLSLAADILRMGGVS